MLYMFVINIVSLYPLNVSLALTLVSHLPALYFNIILPYFGMSLSFLYQVPALDWFFQYFDVNTWI